MGIYVNPGNENPVQRFVGSRNIAILSLLSFIRSFRHYFSAGFFNHFRNEFFD